MQLSMKRLAFAITALSVAPTVVIADDDPGAGKHAAVLAAMAKKACVPPAKVVVSKKDDVVNYYAAYLASENNALVACVSRTQTLEIAGAGKPFQCWTIDPTTNALAARSAAFVPGRSYRIPSGCAEGYCKPKEKPNPDASEEIVAFSADGTKVARVGETIQIYDAKTKAFQREFPMLDEKTGEGNGLGLGDVVYVGDTLIVVGYAAGPDGGAWIWNAAKGKYLGPVGSRNGESGGYVNIYGGGYELADATHFVAHDGGYEEATVDMTTGAVSMRTMPKPDACTHEDLMAQQSLDIVGDGDKVKPKCTKAVRAAQKKFWTKAPLRGFLGVGGKGYKLKHGAKAELLVLDANAAKPKTVQLPVCKLK
jgi:hypothetical protein